MKRFFLSVFALTMIFVSNAETFKINDSWRFSLSDDPSASEQLFDDSNWRTLELPHDWAFEGGYSADAAQRDKGGYAMGGVGWYRRELQLTKSDIAESIIFIDFDGVYMNPEVWINGEYLGKRPYGYIPFSYELTQHLKEGKNTISVRVDNSLEPSARWYHGCGIYADVSLRIKQSAYFEKDGTFVQTPTMSSVKVTSEIVAQESQKVSINYSVNSPSGATVAKGELSKIALNEGLQSLPINIGINSAELWSPDSPALYTLNMEIIGKGGKVVDQQEIRFGFRTVEWSTERGFLLNGEQLKLRGVCEHMEGGPIGALSPESIVRWKMQLIKNMGCNAVRFTHNPFLPIYYDVCDEIGLLVMDEVFDGWNQKAEFDYGFQAFDEWWERDLTDWIRRDRNHPSVFLYSVGNETHGDIAPSLVEACHRSDPTRMVTSGDCNPDDMDVYGVNGRSEKIEDFIDKWDKRKPFVATENPHTWQVRGYYRTQTWYRDGYPNVRQGTQYVPNLTEEEIFGYDWTTADKRRSKKQIFNSSYDNAFVRVTARHLIEVLRDREWFSGSFRWTGFDYRGEAGYVHGGWPFRAFQSGALDVAGFEKDLYYLYQSQWSDKDMAHILPHWTHPNMEQNTKIPVWVYTNGDEAELFLDGESLGRKSRGERWDEMQLEWMVPWCEGRLEVIAYRNGVEIARDVEQSAGAPSQLGVTLDDKYNFAQDSDLAILTIAQEDNNGVLYPYGENRVYAKVYGAARMLSFDNGSPINTETNFEAESMCCFMGLNRMFIQPTLDSTAESASVIVASILGDKRLTLSDKISIVTEEVALDGEPLKGRKIEIRYTTDGSEPTSKSTLYKEPFSIALSTTVRAKIYADGDEIFSMQEHFAEDEGLHWGTPGEEVCLLDGIQAEDATLDRAYFSKKTGDGFYADGYVLFQGEGSSITFYQENDGDEYDAQITIRYSQKSESSDSTKMELFKNDMSVGVIEFKNSGSETSNWVETTTPVTISSGGNNLKFVVLTDNAPTFDQIKIVQQ